MLFFKTITYESKNFLWVKKDMVPLGFEPRTPDSKSGVLTTTLWDLYNNRNCQAKQYIPLVEIPSTSDAQSSE